MYWLIAGMFWIGVLANIIGIAMGGLKFSALTFFFFLSVAVLFTAISIKGKRRAKKS